MHPYTAVAMVFYHVFFSCLAIMAYCLYCKVCVETSESHISVIGFALFGHCHYLLTDPRTSENLFFLFFLI